MGWFVQGKLGVEGPVYHTLPHHGPHNLAEDHVRHAERATVVEGCPIVTVERESQRLSGLLGL